MTNTFDTLIDTVVQRNELGDLARVADGTSIRRCLAIYNGAKAAFEVSATSHDGWTFTVEQFVDCSRRIYAVGPDGQTSWLDGYPVEPNEYLEDIEGLPEEVLDALAESGVHRARATAAQRVVDWIHGQGGQNLSPVLVIDRRVPGNTYASVYWDGSAVDLHGNAVDWYDVVYGADPATAAEFLIGNVALGCEPFANEIRRAIKEVAAR